MAEEIDPSARFARARKRAKQETGAQTQQAQEALKRRFASQGLQASGEAIKQEQIAQEKGGKALERRLESISGAEETEGLRRQEIKEGREFARGEREAGQAFGAEQAAIGRKFGAEQAGLGREFARGERIAGQTFAGQQAGLSREFARGERIAGQEFAGQQAEIGRQFSAQQNQANRDFQENVVLPFQESQFREQMDLAKEQFAFDAEVTKYNQELNEAEANKKNIFDRIGGLATEQYNNPGFDGTIFEFDF